MMKYYFFALMAAAILFFGSAQSNSQVDYRNITGAKKGELDTLARETSQMNVKETSGLLEKEINPSEYMLGPNDEFTINIVSAKPRQYVCRISPDGNLIIPEVGLLNLKGKLLSEAYLLLNQKLGKTFQDGYFSVALTDFRKFKVSVSGAIPKPSMVPATAVDRVSEIIERAGGLKYDASVRNIILLREATGERLHVDLLRFYLLGEKAANPFVLGGDKVLVPPNSERSIIGIYGDVSSPAEYEFVEGDSLSTLVRFALGFLESAKLDSVEFTRLSNVGLTRTIIDLSSWKNIMRNSTNLNGDFLLNAGDRIYVRTIPHWKEMKYVVIKGEVNYPGKYAIVDNKENISSLIDRAGGFTADASLESVEFIRQSELDKKDDERERLERTPASEMSESEYRYFQARKTEKRGAMAIDFRKIIKDPNCDDNIHLMNKDSIVVPSQKNFVNVQGRVTNPGLVIYKKGMTYLDYINLAGGYAFRADEGETMIAKSRGGQFLAEDMNYIIEPGDVILVPPQKEHTFFEALTTGLTIVTQLLTIAGVVLAFIRL